MFVRPDTYWDEWDGSTACTPYITGGSGLPSARIYVPGDRVLREVKFDLPDVVTALPVAVTATGWEFTWGVHKIQWVNTPGKQFALKATFPTAPPVWNLRLRLSLPSGVQCYYQPPLTEEYTVGQVLADGAVVESVTPTTVRVAGKVYVYRPEDVVGSYALLDTHGKIGHLYRPWVEDAHGQREWCSMEWQPASTTLVLRFPKAWMQSGQRAWPILLDPTFGYTTAGGSWQAFHNSIKSLHGTLTEGGTITQLTAHVGPDTANKNCLTKGAIYTDADPLALVSGSQTSEVNLNWPSTTRAWTDYTLLASKSLTAANYYLTLWGQSGESSTWPILSRDTGGTRNLKTETYVTGTGDWPATIAVDTEGYYDSIYATYTAGGESATLAATKAATAAHLKRVRAFRTSPATRTPAAVLTRRAKAFRSIAATLSAPTVLIVRRLRRFLLIASTVISTAIRTHKTFPFRQQSTTSPTTGILTRLFRGYRTQSSMEGTTATLARLVRAARTLAKTTGTTAILIYEGAQEKLLSAISAVSTSIQRRVSAKRTQAGTETNTGVVSRLVRAFRNQGATRSPSATSAGIGFRPRLLAAVRTTTAVLSRRVSTFRTQGGLGTTVASLLADIRNVLLQVTQSAVAATARTVKAGRALSGALASTVATLTELDLAGLLFQTLPALAVSTATLARQTFAFRLLSKTLAVVARVLSKWGLLEYTKPLTVVSLVATRTTVCVVSERTAVSLTPKRTVQEV